MSLYADVLLVLAILGNATQKRNNSICFTPPKEVMAIKGGKNMLAKWWQYHNAISPMVLPANFANVYRRSFPEKAYHWRHTRCLGIS